MHATPKRSSIKQTPKPSKHDIDVSLSGEAILNEEIHSVHLAKVMPEWTTGHVMG